MADYIACVDAGNGGTNAALVGKNGKLTVVYIPSIRAAATGERLGLDKGLELSYQTVQWGGHRYITGDDAVTISKRALERHMGTNSYGNEFHQFLIAKALADMGVKSGTVDLTVCVPPGVFREVKPVILERFKSYKHHAAIWLSGEARPRDWEYESVTVMPEGICAAACFVLDDKGKKVKSDIFSGDVVVIDVGAYTVDALLLQNGNFNPETLQHTTWENEGVDLHIRQPILSELKRQSQEFSRATVDDIDLAIRRGVKKGKYTVAIGGYEADITPLVTKQSERYAEWISNNIGDGLFNAMRGIKRLIVVGGGAVLVTSYLRKWYGDKVVDPNAFPSTKNVHVADMNAVGGLRLRLKTVNVQVA